MKIFLNKVIIIVICFIFFICNCIVIATNNVYIDAKAYGVYDRNTKQMIWGKNIQDKMPMASTTKIMTGVLVVEYGKLDEIVTVTKNAEKTSGWQLNLKEGDKIVLKDLLYATMLYSANDGAIALAEHIGGSVEGFCLMMNNKAKEIGAYNTNFTSPHGLDNPNHYSTVYDMAIIADYAMENELFRNVVKTPSYNITINGSVRTVNNTNKLLSIRENITGIKTGYTGDAMYCLVSGVRENGNDLIAVLFGANTSNKRFQESKKMLEYTLENFIQIDLSKYIKESIELKVDKGEVENINAYPKDIPKIYIDKKDIQHIVVNYMVLEKVSLPLNSDEVVGLATVYVKNEKICTIEYTTKENISRNSIKYYYEYIMKNYVNLLKINY